MLNWLLEVLNAFGVICFIHGTRKFQKSLGYSRSFKNLPWILAHLVEFSRLLAPGRPRFRASSHVYLSALAARRARRPSRSSRGQATLPKYELRDFAWKNS